MSLIKIIEFIVFFIVCSAFSILINSLFLKFTKTLGIRNNGETVIRWSSESKPAIGGISFYIIFLLSIIGYSFIFENSIYFLNLNFLGVIIASTIGFLLGLFDDAYDTKPLIKLFAQILCGVILIFTNVYIRIFDSEILNYLITIIWVVGMMNSINMLDNMDAITTLVSISILSTIIISLFISGNFNNPDLFIMLGLLASLVGFLKFNWSPATIYMGDTGSQFLGAFLSAIGIIYFWNNNDNVSEMLAISKQIIVTVLVFSIPIIDTTTVVIKRLRKGKSPFIGGKDHTAHHISYLGFNDKQVALIFICISVITMILTIIAINFIQIWSYLYVCLYVAYLFLLFISLFYIANLNIQKN